jgi:carboxyl-terminal processing protease
MITWKRGIVVLLALGATGCPALNQGPQSPSECTTAGQNTFVQDTMKDIYLWYDKMPNVDAKSYDSPEALLEAIRYKTLDTHFSFISSKAEDAAYYSDSKFIGMGFGTEQTSPTELRLAQVFPDSPASDARLARGDFLITVNGKAVADMLKAGAVDFGASQIGVQVQLEWRSPGGQSHSAMLTKREVTIPTVSVAEVYPTRSHRVGYVFLRNFVQPSVSALDNAFAMLEKEGADELVLDLRYNGGGLVSVAQHLGGLIGGKGTSGKVFAEFFHNDKNTGKNNKMRFEDPAHSLDLRRLTAITTRGSASASESVINGLRPFMTVTVVGDTTYGKPVGQYGYDFCDSVLYPVSFQVRNALGQGDYFAGIPVDCAAADDLEHGLGNTAEASLAEALHFVETGSCSGHAAAAARIHQSRRAAVPQPLSADGWRQLINAY